MTKTHHHRTTCKSCESDRLVPILDLGEMALANAFIRPDDAEKPEIRVPLATFFCESCGLLQLLDEVDPAVLFRDYDYLTSASAPLAEHFRQMAHYLAGAFITDPHDLMVEIGGNDGVLLEAAKNHCRVLNVDPATNVIALAEKRGVPTLNDFFNAATAGQIVREYGRAKVVVANNVMAHIPDIKGVFAGVASLIGENGVFVMEVHWVGNLIGEGGFDQIYHEHLYYYSLHALQTLVRQFGLDAFDVELVPIHGESMRVFIAKGRAPTNRLVALLTREEKMGLTKKDAFLHFSEKVARAKAELLDLLHGLKREGKRIVGYGAPAKGNTLLNYFGITPDILDYVTDTTPLKQGLLTPGAHIPVVSPERLLLDKPDYVLLLAWNYADAILKKEAPLRDRGVKFIIPVPEVRVV